MSVSLVVSQARQMCSERQSVITDEKTAAAEIRDGMTVAIGGFINSGTPMCLIRQIIKNGVRDLTVVGPASSGLGIDLMIGAGCVKRIVTAYMGAEVYCPVAPFFRAMAEDGQLDVWECDEGHYYSALRAAALQLPFLPWRTGVGTSYAEVNPDLKLFTDPIKGETLIAVPAIQPDIAIVHAAHADAYGNVQHIGTGFGDRALHKAARKTIVEVEKVVSNEEIRKNPQATSLDGVSAVVRAPFGAHPYASPGYYLEDAEHIREYVAAASPFVKTRDRSLFDQYLDKYVYGPDEHADYLELIGIKRLISLHEF